MFVPSDPRFLEILQLANQALGPGLRAQERVRWRELVTQLLGALKTGSAIPERRRDLRAAASLTVHVLSPDELAGLKTSTVGPGGLSIRMDDPPPPGTELQLSVQVADRPQPMLLRAQVMWTKTAPHGEIGAAFIDAYQNDRELLEATAVKALLAAEAVY